MKKKIDDVRKALKNETYYCALALALTFPDICCHIENGLSAEQNAIGEQYINWVNTHIDSDFFQFPATGFNVQTFGGEMCYSLRCKVLHAGHTDVTNKRLNVTVDKFKLTFPDDPDYFHGFRYMNNHNGETITHIGIDYLCECLCDAAEKFYNSWSNKADFNNFSF